MTSAAETAWTINQAEDLGNTFAFRDWVYLGRTSASLHEVVRCHIDDSMGNRMLTVEFNGNAKPEAVLKVLRAVCAALAAIQS